MAAEKLDLGDLDAEDLKALEEVQKKGYYHARPKTDVAANAPQLVAGDTASPAPVPLEGAAVAPQRRADFDAYQKKWDRFGDDDPDLREAAGSSSAARIHNPAPPAPPEADEAVVTQLVGMGFSESDSRQAAVATRNSVDAAVDYLFKKTSAPAARAVKGPVDVDAEKLALMVEMGFSEERSRRALVACGNDVLRATDHASQAADAAAAEFDGVRAEMTRLEADVAAFEADSCAGGSKRLRSLNDSLTQASCRLDTVAPAGDEAARAERRAELDRCNVLEARLKGLEALAAAAPVSAPAFVPFTFGAAAAPQSEIYSVSGASGEFAVCNGAYERVGLHNDRPKYKNVGSPAIMFFTLAWKMHVEDDTTAWSYDAPEGTQSELAAPTGDWSYCADATKKIRVVRRDDPALQPPPAPAGPATDAEKRVGEAERLRLEGNRSFKAGEYEKAAENYLGALGMDPDDVAILQNLAAAEIKLGLFDAAMGHADAANSLTGGFSAKALFRKGQALEGMGQLDEACEAFKQAVDVDPNDRSVRQRLQECRKIAKAAKEAAAKPDS